jgi:CRP-like cAMP-binding protein
MNTLIQKKAGPRKVQSAREELKSLIAAHPFAKGLSGLHLGALADYAMAAEFAPGEMIFHEGEIANRFYLLLSGEVLLESRTSGSEPVMIQTLGAGDVLGWSWMFEPYVWHFDARALKATQAIFFYGTWLREFCNLNPELGYGVIKRIAQVVIQRLQTTRHLSARARQEMIQPANDPKKPPGTI